MVYINQKPRRISPSSFAADREQRRNDDLDREDRNKSLPTVFVKGFAFRPYYNSHDNIQMKGPLCPNSITKERQCLAPLVGDNEQSLKSHCDVCDKNFSLPHNFQDFRSVAHKAYDGLLNSQTELITLDVPYEAVKAEAEDDTRKVKVVWSQKDGRNQAIIYLIEKDGNGSKSQIFADLDREEIRYDAGDIPPEQILAKIKAVFKSTKINNEFVNKES